MKIHFVNWGRSTFKTPHFVIINQSNYMQIAFVVAWFCWYVIINKKTK
jgi:hypothetical protein